MSNALTNANVVTFITTDPYAVGFAAIRAAHPGSDAELIAAANNKTGPGSGTEPADPISKSSLYSLIDPTNLAAMNTQDIGLWGMLPDPVNIGESGTQANLEVIFAGFTATLSNLSNAYVQTASPWERYFGPGQMADTGTLDAARNSGSGNNF